MTRDRFWELIKDARGSVGRTSEVPVWLEERLSKMSETEIVEFGSHFDECQSTSYDARLWLAAVVILGGCSDDSFWDFRGWLIAQGRKVFEGAVADPDSLAELELERFDGDPRLEAILYVGAHAYCRRIGRDRYDFEARQQYDAMRLRGDRPQLKQPELLSASDVEAGKLFPKLAARFPRGIHSIGREAEPPVFPRCD